MNIYSTQKQQSGVVLVISLIMLLLLTLIGVTSMQVTGLEEKMAGNSKDINMAFQAAEASLRNAEADIDGGGRISGLTNMTNTCTNGLCFFDGAVVTDIWDDTAKVANAVTYGTYATATNITGLAAQPRYLIEAKYVQVPGTNGKYVYTITAIAQGGAATTESVLQEVFIP